LRNKPSQRREKAREEQSEARRQEQQHGGEAEQQQHRSGREDECCCRIGPTQQLHSRFAAGDETQKPPSRRIHVLHTATCLAVAANAVARARSERAAQCQRDTAHQQRRLPRRQQQGHVTPQHHTHTKAQAAPQSAAPATEARKPGHRRLAPAAQQRVRPEHGAPQQRRPGCGVREARRSGSGRSPALTGRPPQER